MMSVLAVIIALLLAARTLRLSAWQTAFALGLAGLFQPLMSEIERGQIDSITLLLLTLTIINISDDKGHGRHILAGVLLALAGLLKLHCLFMLPFLILRRKRYAVRGFLGGVVVITIASLALNGPRDVSAYLSVELPRIDRYGQDGDPMRILGAADRTALGAPLVSDSVWKDGRIYARESFAFRSNGSAVRVAQSVLSALSAHGIGPTAISLSLLLLSIVVIWLRLGDLSLERDAPPDADFVYWQIVLVVILMTGPMTWSMNLVWLLPTTLVACRIIGDRSWRRATSRPAQTIAWYLMSTGLLIAAMPDDRSFPSWLPLLSPLFAGKYVIAEMLVLVGLLQHARELSLPARQQQAARGDTINPGYYHPRLTTS